MQNSLDDIERKKKALPLFYGSPDFDDLNALGMQANRIRQSVTLKIGQIQNEINKLQKQNPVEQTVREAQTVSTTTETIPQNIPAAIPESQTVRTTSASIINETIPVIKKPSVLPKVLLGGLILTLISA